MNYLPNAAARSLKTNRTYNLGVLFADDTQSGLTHEYFSNVLNSFKVEAESYGYDITFISHNVGGRATTYLEHCRYRNIDGIMVACVNFLDSQVLELISSNIPTVTIDYAFDNCTAVISDNVSGMQELVSYVLECGHKTIAFIHGEKTSVTKNRLTGFYKTCCKHGVEILDEYVLEARFHSPKSVAKRVKELLQLRVPPTCIFIPDDCSYSAVLNVIQNAGLRVPDDISIVGYDGITLSQMLMPKLTTYKQDTYLLGKTAAIQLVSLIEKPKTTLSEHIVIQGKLLEGHSVRLL